MRISIITACLNNENTIEGTINSVFSQDYPDMEYIVIDGGSTDSTLEIISRYRNNIDYFISEPDQNMYEAINKGIYNATGDIIGLLHSDDEFYSTDVLSAVAKVFEKKDTDIVYGDGVYVNKYNTDKVVRNWISGEYKKSAIRHGWLPLHPTVYAKKRIFDEAGYYNEFYRIAGDTDWLIKVLYKYDFNVYYLHKYLVKMRMGGLSTSLTLKGQIEKWEEDIRLYKKNGLNAHYNLFRKVLRKIKQFR